MRTTTAWVVLGMLGMLSCAGSPPAAVAEPAAGEAKLTLEKAPDSGQVDRVGPSDGALTADGTNDLSFVTQLEGPVAALFLVGVDDSGKPTGSYQADTLVGASESPVELGAKPGSGTSGLGVFEGDKALNTKEGALDAVAAGPHRFTLYVAPTAALTAGTKLRVYALLPDKTLLAGPTIIN